MGSERHTVCRQFNLTLISASDLENVRQHFKMKVYCKVSIGGQRKAQKKTPIDRNGLVNPTWNYQMGYNIAERAIVLPGLMVVIELYCKRKLGDRYIGEVQTSVKELFDYAYPRGGNATLTLPLHKGSKISSHGELKFSYWFGERFSVENPSFMDRVVPQGVWMLMQATAMATIGSTLPIDAPVSGELDIVDFEEPRS